MEHFLGARQNLHRHSSGARRRQIVVCRRRARRLPSTGQTDKIPKGSSTSAVNGPDICRQRARRLPSTGQTDKFQKVARRLPSTYPTSAVDGPDKQTQAMSAVNGPDVCRQRARCLLSTGPTNKLKQYLLLTSQTSAVNLSKG